MFVLSIVLTSLFSLFYVTGSYTEGEQKKKQTNNLEQIHKLQQQHIGCRSFREYSLPHPTMEGQETGSQNPKFLRPNWNFQINKNSH